jgi:TIR domain-containing protein
VRSEDPITERHDPADYPARGPIPDPGQRELVDDVAQPGGDVALPRPTPVDLSAFPEVRVEIRQPVDERAAVPTRPRRRRAAKPSRGPGGPASAATIRGHVFISYVRQDSARVDWLQEALSGRGVRVWRDTADLWPGEDWHARIRQAITSDALVFLACFSRNSLARTVSYQNEELLLAIEQLRRRRPGEPWLIPVRFDDCDIPELDIGGGRTLGSLQCADLFGAHFDEQIARLITAILRILGRTQATPTSSLARRGPRRVPPSPGWPIPAS